MSSSLGYIITKGWQSYLRLTDCEFQAILGYIIKKQCVCGGGADGKVIPDLGALKVVK